MTQRALNNSVLCSYSVRQWRTYSRKKLRFWLTQQLGASIRIRRFALQVRQRSRSSTSLVLLAVRSDGTGVSSNGTHSWNRATAIFGEAIRIRSAEILFILHN